MKVILGTSDFERTTVNLYFIVAVDIDFSRLQIFSAMSILSIYRNKIEHQISHVVSSVSMSPFLYWDKEKGSPGSFV